jgi:hypothetical protein
MIKYKRWRRWRLPPKLFYFTFIMETLGDSFHRLNIIYKNNSNVFKIF